jgi:hypothetical protein
VPLVDTKATGSAEFTAPHFDSIVYSVNVSNMDNITAAHIHSGKTGANGPILVTLFKRVAIVKTHKWDPREWQHH